MKLAWFALGLGLVVGCRSAAIGSDVKSESGAPREAAKEAPAAAARVGTDPGGIAKGAPVAPAGRELAAFAGGCFWGTEDLFRQVPGVTATAVGYTGGHTANPTYDEVCSHTTGHAETVLVEFDPAKVTYEHLLDVFFENHDPTTMNRQGPDVGDQYRSEVFAVSAAQEAAARAAIGRAQAKRTRKVVTRVTRLGTFTKAEEYHQQYDEKTGRHSCPIGKPAHGDGT